MTNLHCDAPLDVVSLQRILLATSQPNETNQSVETHALLALMLWCSLMTSTSVVETKSTLKLTNKLNSGELLFFLFYSSTTIIFKLIFNAFMADLIKRLIITSDILHWNTRNAKNKQTIKPQILETRMTKDTFLVQQAGQNSSDLENQDTDLHFCFWRCNTLVGAHVLCYHVHVTLMSQ